MNSIAKAPSVSSNDSSVKLFQISETRMDYFLLRSCEYLNIKTEKPMENGVIIPSLNVLEVAKGQMISKWFLGVFDFLQKTNENKST